MSTSKSSKVYSGYPFVIKANAKGFYDYNMSNIANTSKTIDVNMDEYALKSSDFIEINQETDVPLTINSSVFETPDYDQLDNNTTVLKQFSENKYCNVPEKVLDLEIKDCTLGKGVLSDFSGSSKCEIIKTFPELSSFKMIINATVSDVSTVQYLIFGKYPDQISGIDIVSKKMTFYTASSGDTQGVTELKEGKTYWFALNKEEDKFVAYLLEETEAFDSLDNLPEFSSNWSKEFELSTDYFSNKVYWFGCSEFNTGCYWRGSIDLNKSLIEANGSVFFNKDSKHIINEKSCYGNLYNYVDDGSAKTLGCWFAKNNTTFTKHLILTDLDQLTMEGYTTRYLSELNVPAHDLFDYSETLSAGGENKSYTLKGEATVSDDLVLSNFGSQNNYLSMDCAFPANSTNWEFITKVNSDSYTTGTRFFVTDPIDAAGHFGIALGCNSYSNIWVWLSSDGQSYDIASGKAGSTTLKTGKDYWLKLSYNGSNYIVSISEDGTNYIEDINVESTTPVFASEGLMEIGVHGSNYTPKNTKIFLKDTQLKIGGNTFWKLEYKIPKWVKK